MLKQMIKPKRIESLSGLRFIFMVIIMLSHMEFLMNTLYGDMYTKYLHNATMSVDFFFILSGFVMGWNYEGRRIETSFKSSLTFCIKKIKKFYCIYLISMAVCIPYSIIQMQSVGKSPVLAFGIIAVRILVCLPLLQSMFGVTALSHSFNGVCWFLSTTAILYFFTLLLLRLQRRLKKSRMGCALIFIVCVFMIPVVYSFFQHIENASMFDDLKYGSPYIRVIYYICGMLLCDLYRYLDAKLAFVKDMSTIEGGYPDLLDVVACI